MRTIIAAFCIVFCTVANLYAVQLEPATLSYQGTLTDNTGIALTGTKSLRVCLYKTPTAGTSFWCDNYSVTLKNGQFSIILGSDSNKLTDQFSNFTGETYIGIKVGSDAEMPQRQRVTSVAYAINAVNAQNSTNATNAVNASVASTVVSTNTESIIPSGMVSAFAGEEPPNGWLLCDGRKLNIADYPKLYNAIKWAHGKPSETEFNLPDYRGRFLRGVDYSPNYSATSGVPVGSSSGRDPDLAGRTAMQNGGNLGNTGPTARTSIGSVQEDIMTSHTHGYDAFSIRGDASFGNVYTPQGWYSMGSPIWNTAPAGGSETRPKNAYVNWIIKF